ncbi:hypothetical protein [Microbacterium maritypicum]
MPYALFALDGVLPIGPTPLASMLPIMQAAMLLACTICAVRGVFLLFSPYQEGGWWFIGFALFGAGGTIVFPMLLDGFTGEEAGPRPSPSATSSPSGEPSNVPDVVREPADLSWLFIVLGILLAAILAAVLVWVLVTVGQKARRNIREGRERVKAEQERMQRLSAGWQTFRDRHDELLRKITHAETDWDSLFFTPALTDPNVDQTHRMLLAMRTANTLRDTAGGLPSGLAADADLTALAYPRAVEAFARAWDIAERHARRVGQKSVPLAERKTIKEIRTLLDIAENSTASQTERNLAYRRAQKLIASLNSIHVPQSLMAQLEESHRFMLTAVPTPGATR